MKTHFYIGAAIAALTLGGCAATTAAIAPDGERSVIRSIDDSSAERTIKARMTRQEGFALTGVDIEVAEGVVLLSGRVPRPEDRIEAERIAWSAPNVIKVGNEIGVGGKQGLAQNIKDEWLAKNVRTRLAADTSIRSINYNIEAHDSIIYLMGVARTPDELKGAAKHASVTPGVVKVISYVRVAQSEIERPSHQADYVPTIPKAADESFTYTYPQTLPEAPDAPTYSAPSIPQSEFPSSQGYESYNPDPTDDGYIPYGEEFSEEPLVDILPDAPLVDVLPDAPFDIPQIQPAPQTTPQPNPQSGGDSEPFYRDPITGERIELPPGTVTVPYDPNRKW